MVKLPLSKEPMTRTEFNSIFIIVNWLTKWKMFISYKESSTTEDLAYAFFRWIVADHGLPQELVLDRDKLFIFRF